MLRLPTERGEQHAARAPSCLVIDWLSEGTLLTRPRDAVEWIGLDASGCAFLDACAAGDTLTGAARAALAAQADADLDRLMSALLEAGAFSRMGFTVASPSSRSRP